MLRSRTSTAFYHLKRCHQTVMNVGIRQSANITARLLHAHSAARRVAKTCCSRLCFSTWSPSSLNEYRWINGVERLELYGPGGYHPVVINDSLQKRYRIVDKLGFGGCSTIWLARDEIDNRYVAVKIGSSKPSLPRREVEILRALHGPRSSSQAAAVPTILDAFDVQGPNGTHPCYTAILTQGNLREASYSRLFPVHVARALAAKLATAVAFVHARGFVHGGLSYYITAYLLYPKLTGQYRHSSPERVGEASINIRRAFNLGLSGEIRRA